MRLGNCRQLAGSVVRWMIPLLVATSLSLTFVGTVRAQTGANPANCEELKDPDTKFQMEMCSAHVGCRMVMGIHTACVKAKKFLDNLKSVMSRDDNPVKDPVSPGNSLFGRLKSLVGSDNKEVNSNHVFEASMSDEMRAADARDKDWQTKVKPIKDGLSQSKKEILVTNSDAYIGEVKNGKPDGWGVRFWPSGYITRGSFRDGTEWGKVDVLGDDQTTRVVTSVDSRRNGDGLMLLSDGRTYKGSIAQLNIAAGQGAFYRNDGSLISKGSYNSGVLQVGEEFDPAGKLVQKVDIPGDARRAVAERAQQLQAQQQKEEQEKRAAQDRTRAEQAALEQRRRDEAAAADAAYRQSLASMNPGQLFARADELASSGDRVRAREVLRTLVSRFPDHALAATAAQQLSAIANPGNSANAASSSQTGSQPVSARSCEDALAKKEVEYTALNRRPLPQGATPGLKRVMWMTADTIKVIDAFCAGDPKAAQQRAEMKKVYDQAKTACEQMSVGQCEPNPY